MKERKIYICSDSHFGHSKMEEWSLRPGDFEESIANGYRQLPEDSILIHLGDVEMGASYSTEVLLRSLSIKKWLVRGNHDKHGVGWYVEHGWDAVCDEMVLNMFGRSILLSHIPQPRREGVSINIHGHLHGGKSRGRPDFYDESFHIEVCPEVIGYTPYKLSTLSGQ